MTGARDAPLHPAPGRAWVLAFRGRVGPVLSRAARPVDYERGRRGEGEKGGRERERERGKEGRRELDRAMDIPT